MKDESKSQNVSRLAPRAPSGYVVTVTGREMAELLDVRGEPGPIGPREVAGRTLATLISAGTELNGAYLGNNFPATPGYAAVFEVESKGADVTGLEIGDRALCMGPHRSFQRVDASGAIPVPEGLAPEKAVFARLMSVSMSTLTTTTARPPQMVLTLGLGIIGYLAARVFAGCGYRVLAHDPSAERRRMARVAGLEGVLDKVTPEDPELVEKVALVLECSGHEEGALTGCLVVRKRGEVVLIGTPWQQRTELAAHRITHAVFHRYVTLRSGWEWELPLHPAEFRTGAITGNLRAALEWLADGRVPVDGVYETASPRDAQTVYQDLLHARWPRLAAVFDWTGL